MRRSSDLPVDLPRRGFTGRGVLIALGGLFLFVLFFGRAIARFYVDFLWHDALGRGDVFWGVIGAKVVLFVGFFLIFAILAGINLFVADRTAPESFPANVHPYVERFHEVFGRRLRLLRYLVALLFAILLAIPAIARWEEWLLFRNSQDFGIADAQFGNDVGFYVFELPFLTFVLDWMFAAVVIVLLLTIAAHVLNGGVVFVSPAPVVSAATKTHVAVLLAVLAVLKAGDYWLDRYELTNAQTGIVQGATYSVVNAQIPAIMLLILIALLTSLLYFSVAKTGSFRLPVIASALWFVVSIVGGVIYPAAVQGLVVNPNQGTREAEFIERNVLATREAYGLAEVEVRQVEFQPLTAADVESDIEAFDNVRLLNPARMLNRFIFDRGDEAGLTIDDLDVDRYEFGLTPEAGPEQTLVAALELDLTGVTNRSWQGLHLINTHGCGIITAPASIVQANDRPAYQLLDLDRPELYFSPSLTGYAITNTEVREDPCDGTTDETYEGDLGVRVGSIVRRAAFALAFLDYNLLASGAISSDSQMLWVRSVNDRLEKLAPFLSYDADPYPAELDGRAVWVVDAYTTTSRYPYSESVGDVQLSSNSGLSASDNYIRNSVKAVVDAYTGEVTLYVIDPDDPIIQAWQSAFPDLFTNFELMPSELREHLRYPEDLFRVQTDRYSKYRIDPGLFFERQGAWSVAQAPGISPNARSSTPATTATPTAASNTFARESNTERFTPYYTYFDTSEQGEPRDEEFVIFRPFVEFSTADQRTQLQAYMVASSEPDTYGRLITYEVAAGADGQLPDGPLRVASSAESSAEISRRISLDNQEDGGTQVRFGDLQAVPVADGLIYVRPYYVSVAQESRRITETTEYRRVIVTYDERSVISETIGGALAQLFPGFDGDAGDRLSGVVVSDDSDDLAPADPTEDGGDTAIVLDDNAEAILLQIDSVLLAADDALSSGDLGLYQARIQEANALIDEAISTLGLAATLGGETGSDAEEPADDANDGANDEANDDANDDASDGEASDDGN
ncbi:MAG: UPF0182 family protein [Ilumatobacter sp.]|uniref:UPF0182 family protein n=1 Tax=Ilumatobacter sp. TaxID=1967498 RepID=UPI00391B9DA7